MLVGEVLEASFSGKEPLAYHKGKYWKLEKNIEKPQEKELEKIKEIVAKHKKK